MCIKCVYTISNVLSKIGDGFCNVSCACRQQACSRTTKQVVLFFYFFLFDRVVFCNLLDFFLFLDWRYRDNGHTTHGIPPLRAPSPGRGVELRRKPLSPPIQDRQHEASFPNPPFACPSHLKSSMRRD